MKKDNVKRTSFGKCIICGDTAVTYEGDCFYCDWKGNTGKGALLKETIRRANETYKRSNQGNKSV